MQKQNLNFEEVLADYGNTDNFIEVPLSAKVFKIFRIFFLLMVIVILFQLLNISIIKHDSYTARALANVTDVEIEPAPRGLILDRYNEPLVKNEAAFNVFLVPKELPEDSDSRLASLKVISGFLNINEEELNKNLKKANWAIGDRLFLTNELSEDKIINLSANPIPGLAIEPGFKRVERSPLKFSHVIGYVGHVNEEDIKNNPDFSADDEIGKAGLEAYYDSLLRGVNSKKIFFKNALGKTLDTEVARAPEPGKELKTFIDADFQEYFYDRLSSALKSLGRTTGVGIAMNPKNGEILSLVGIPSYDSSQIAKALTEPNNPLFNRAVSGLYSPGSTIKPLVGIAALKESVIKNTDSIFSAGFIEVPNPYDPTHPSRFLDNKAHGWVDIVSALAKSSNIYFYAVGGGVKGTASPIGLGITKLKSWWEKFGLNKKTNIDLPGEKSGFLPDPEWKESKKKEPWRLGDTYNVSIGQGDLLITPLELLSYITGIANGGKIYEPKIANLNVPPALRVDLTNEIQDVVGDVKKGMRSVVSETYGSAHLMNDLPFSVSAKTGTAQIEANTKTNAFVVAFAPSENPQIAIVVLVENAREGSLNVLPIAKEVLLWYYNNRLKS